MHAQCPPVTFRQHLEIPSGLCGYDHAEGVFWPGTGTSAAVVAGDLQEHARIRSTLVCLPGGMQESRAETQAGCRALFVSYQMTHCLQTGFVLVIHLNVCKQGEIVSHTDATQMSLEISGQRFIVPGSLRQGVGVLSIGKELDVAILQNGFFSGKGTGLFVLAWSRRG